MIPDRPFSVRARLRSFVYAGRGLAHLATREHNARVHLVAMVAVVAAGIACRLERWEWGLIALAVALVWAAEALNAALEQLADALHPEPHPVVGRAKDLGAGAVLVAALGAIGIGWVVFGPRLWVWFGLA